MRNDISYRHLPNRALITAALPYVSGRKHIGNLAGSILPADVHARFRRQLGHEVAFVCGTDEHGTPAEVAALAAGIPVANFCATAHVRQQAAWSAFEISFDHFGHTSSPACQAEAVAEFHALQANGWLLPTVRLTPWGTRTGRFLPDRYVVGTCPRCGSEAKGDGCGACGAELEAHELENLRSALDPTETVDLRESRHLAIDLPGLAPLVQGWLDGLLGQRLSAFVRAETTGWLRTAPVRDITRDVQWGVPVPCPGYENKTLYVWFDAPVAYYGLVREWAEACGKDAEEWVSRDASGDWTQFLAKDNVAFHAGWFPAIIFGGRRLRLATRISGHGWLLDGHGSKLSTSGGVGLAVEDALLVHAPSHWRWWLCAHAPENGTDTRYDPTEFAQQVNVALSDNIGNLVSRLSGLYARVGGPLDTKDDSLAALRLHEQVARHVNDAGDAYADLSTRRACAAIQKAWSACNAYIADTAPWSILAHDPEAARRIIATAASATACAVRAAAPIIPSLSRTLLYRLGYEPSLADNWPGLTDRAYEQPAPVPVQGPPCISRIGNSQVSGT